MGPVFAVRPTAISTNPAPNFSAARPAIVGGTLVTGDQDGFVHGIRLP